MKDPYMPKTASIPKNMVGSLEGDGWRRIDAMLLSRDFHLLSKKDVITLTR